MKTTRNQRPEAEFDRERAWSHMLENLGGIRRVTSYGSYGNKRLGEIARRYEDRRRAQGLLEPAVSETDVLAARLVIRSLRDKLDTDELMLITLARSHRITWARIADALEMSNRQSAERRHLQLSRAHPRADGSLPAPRAKELRTSASAGAGAPNGGGPGNTPARSVRQPRHSLPSRTSSSAPTHRRKPRSWPHR
ncbi:hypothetical protein OHB49_42650 (plasmid) [Streptomyces sp. NBC_01717]|uniref:hypothetical protein n=1 Tax=Streptomyces sp. NBC_01717 TaxID=2975918 RepID=UPI002E353A88|nr:hypothetical protein [Streptomyces sp. NBC_01717]